MLLVKFIFIELKILKKIYRIVKILNNIIIVIKWKISNFNAIGNFFAICYILWVINYCSLHSEYCKSIFYKLM